MVGGYCYCLVAWFSQLLPRGETLIGGARRRMQTSVCWNPRGSVGQWEHNRRYTVFRRASASSFESVKNAKYTLHLLCYILR